jgi:hypothetical protein
VFEMVKLGERKLLRTFKELQQWLSLNSSTSG